MELRNITVKIAYNIRLTKVFPYIWITLTVIKRIPENFMTKGFVMYLLRK